MAKDKSNNKTRTLQIRLNEKEATLIYGKARKRRKTLTNLILSAVGKY